jgi:hypothetical protein
MGMEIPSFVTRKQKQFIKHQEGVLKDYKLDDDARH